jgi:glycosyltransferase AglD
MDSNRHKASDGYEYVFMLPVLNEAPILEQSVRLLSDYLREKWPKRGSSWRIIVGDNGSTDGTSEIARRLSEEPDSCVLHRHISERGKGRAIREIVRENYADYYFFLDADLPIRLEAIAEFLEPLERNEADVVCMRRIGKRPLKRRVMTGVWRLATKLLFGLPLHDAQSGAKAFSRRALPALTACNEAGYFLDTEFLIRCNDDRLRIREIEEEWIENRFPERTSKISFFRFSLETLAFMRRQMQRK